MKSAFHRYLELQLKLVDLIAEDKCDSVEADRVRDEMDEPWRQMSAAEHQLLEQVSQAMDQAEERRVG